MLCNYVCTVYMYACVYVYECVCMIYVYMLFMYVCCACIMYVCTDMRRLTTELSSENCVVR